MDITLPLAAVLLFLTTLMFLSGPQVTLADLAAMTRNYGLVARSLLANIVLFAILAVLLAAPAHLPRDVLIGVLLMAAAPGVLFLPRIAAAAKGNLVFAIDLTILLQVVSVVTTPVTLRWILPVEDAVKVPVLRIIVTLVLFQLLPLALGMLVRRQAPQHAAAVARPVRALSTLGLVGTLVFFIVPHLDVLAKVVGGGALMPCSSSWLSPGRSAGPWEGWMRASGKPWRSAPVCGTWVCASWSPPGSFPIPVWAPSSSLIS